MSNKIEKLPKWAQDHIKALQRERDTAVRELNEWVDNQTPAKFYTDDFVCTGEQQGPSIKRRYFQAYKMTVEHAGIRLDINARAERGISIQWGDAGRDSSRDVAFIPSSYQNAEIVTRDKMR